MVFNRINKGIFIIVGSMYLILFAYAFLGTTFHSLDWLNWLKNLYISKEIVEINDALYDITFNWTIEFTGNLLDNIVAVAKAIGNTIANIGIIFYHLAYLMFYAPMKDIINTFVLIGGSLH